MPGYRVEAPYFSDEEFTEHVERMKAQPDPSTTDKGMFLGLQQMPTMYGGTVDPGVVAERRRKNKQARKSRKINRRAAKK
jgi:hypothetical protein